MTELTSNFGPIDGGAPTPKRAGVIRRLLKNPLATASAAFLVLIFLAGTASPLIAPFDPNYTRLELTDAQPFTSSFLLGGDQVGRDVLSRLLTGTQGTLICCLIVLVVSLAIGVPSGLVAGYRRGVFDIAASWVSDALMTFPAFVLLMAMTTVIGPNIYLAMAVFGVLVSPAFFRLVRTQVINVRHEPYIDAATVFGLSDSRIIVKHILRAIRGPIVIQSAFVLSAAIGIQAGLEFLGLGNKDQPSWGLMLQDAFNNLYVNPLNIIWPAGLVTGATLSFVLLGNAVRDTLQGSKTANKTSPRTLQRYRERALAELEPTNPSPKPAGTRQPLLSVTGLAIGYPGPGPSLKTVVHGVDLAIMPGEVHGLVGESGSGKSQTAYSVLGILPKDAVVIQGTIEFDGVEILSNKAAMLDVRGRRIAYVPQEPMRNLDPLFTVGQQLSYRKLAHSHLGRRQAREELLELLNLVGIKDPRKVYGLYPHQISGGMAQRVLIAGAVSTGPDLIVADEPTTALDVTVQAEVLDLLRDLQKERQLAVLLVTHNLGVVADICDRVSVMRHGKIVECQDSLALFDNPQHEYTKMLLAAAHIGSDGRRPVQKGKVTA